MKPSHALLASSRWTWLPTLLLLCFGAAAAKGSPADDALHSLLEEYWESEVRESPLSASMFGETRFADLVDDVSLEAFEARKQRLDETMLRLSGIEKAALSAGNAEEYDIFAWDA